MLCFLVSALILETSILSVIHSVPHFLRFCALLVISLFKWPLGIIAEPLCSLLKCRKVLTCLQRSPLCITEAHPSILKESAAICGGVEAVKFRITGALG